MAGVTNTGPLSVVTHALEGLEPEIRSLLLSHKTSTTTRVNDNDEMLGEEEDLEVVTRCVRHVMSQAPTGAKQQEAAIRAAQQLETTAQRVDQELHTEVVSCHEQLLSTIAASGDLSTELYELAQGIKTLQQSVRRMKLHASGPVQLLQKRVASLERFDHSLTLITLIKRLGNQVRLFEAQFSQHLQKQSSTESASVPTSLDLPKAAQSQREIEALLESIARFADDVTSHPPIASMPIKPLTINSIDTTITTHFPMLQHDLQWIRQNGRSLLSIANASLTLGTTEKNVPALMTSCQVLLWYGGSNNGVDLLIKYLRPIMERLIQTTTEMFDTKAIANAMSASSLQSFSLTGTLTSMAPTVSQEAANVVWKSLQQFLKELELGLQRCFSIDQVLEALGHDEDLMNSIGLTMNEGKMISNRDESSELVKRVSKALGNDNVAIPTSKAAPIATIFWTRTLKEFQTQFRRISATSQSFNQFLLNECPKLAAIVNASAIDIQTIWKTELRAQAARQTGTTGSFVFGSLTMINSEDTSVSQCILLLHQITSPIIKEYLETARTNVIQPVKFMFPLVRDMNGTSSSLSGHPKSSGFPTTADIKVYVNVIVSELNKAAPAQTLHAEVLKAVEESLVLCASRLRDLRDTEGMKIAFPTTEEMTIPQATPGHRRNAKLHEICQILCSSLLHVFGSDEQSHKQSIMSQNDLLSIHVQPEYAILKKVLHLLFAMKETFISNWFRGLQRYICEVHLLSLLRILSIQSPNPYYSGNQSEPPTGSIILQHINEIAGFVTREYFSLLPSFSLSTYGAALSRALIQYFLAVCVLVKPLNKETQRVAFAAHLTSFEVTLSGFFCPKLRELLSVECAAMKSFRRLLFLEGSSHFHSLSTDVGSSSSSLHPEVASVLQTLPFHIILLHLLARLPNSIPGVSEFLGQSLSQSATEIAEAFSFTTATSSQDKGLGSPSIVRSKIKSILAQYTNELGDPLDKSGIWTSEEASIVLFMRRELGLAVSSSLLHDSQQ